MNIGYKICFFVLIFQNTGELIRKLERKYKGKNESDKSPVCPDQTSISLLTG